MSTSPPPLEGGLRPMKVTCELAGPIAGPDVPMLDALLEWAMSSRMGAVWDSRNGHRHHTRMAGSGSTPTPGSRVGVVPGAIPIPVARRRVAGYPHPIPLASSPIFSAADDRHEHYARRFDVDPGLIRPDGRKVFQAGSGEFKSYRLPLRVRQVDRVVWFCAGRTGNANLNSPGKEVRRLLRDVTHLGKKTSQGYGRVAGWTVELVEQDWSWFAPSPHGPVLMRPLPTAAVPADVIGRRPWFGGLVAPYWMPEHFGEGEWPC